FPSHLMRGCSTWWTPLQRRPSDWFPVSSLLTGRESPEVPQSWTSVSGLKDGGGDAPSGIQGPRPFRALNISTKPLNSTFHFLLTRALQDLRTSKTPCYDVFRGVRNIHFSTTVDDTVRFGQFTSSSRQEWIAQCFAEDPESGVGQPVAKTIFEINTCHGVLIREFSSFPNEDEVLIPPYEQFRVVSSRKDDYGATRIKLDSAGKFSKYNCAYASVHFLKKVYPCYCLSLKETEVAHKVFLILISKATLRSRIERQ
uniref:NAD(P)(+)--arginine ADP-ribosyltransferase n=1 Tax=Podarcis muralis TaxID=64176 RepID=A0A670JEJ7_PODMU